MHDVGSSNGGRSRDTRVAEGERERKKERKRVRGWGRRESTVAEYKPLVEVCEVFHSHFGYPRITCTFQFDLPVHQDTPTLGAGMIYKGKAGRKVLEDVRFW